VSHKIGLASKLYKDLPLFVVFYANCDKYYIN
jgi:hypothetical protein